MIILVEHTLRYKAELYRSLGAFAAFSIDFNTVSVITSISVLYGCVLARPESVISEMSFLSLMRSCVCEGCWV